MGRTRWVGLGLDLDRFGALVDDHRDGRVRAVLEGPEGLDPCWRCLVESDRLGLWRRGLRLAPLDLDNLDESGGAMVTALMTSPALSPALAPGEPGATAAMRGRMA